MPSPNRPAARKLRIDWTHIAERHLPEGKYTAGRTLFLNLSRRQIERLIRAAYGNAKLMETQTDFGTSTTRQRLNGSASVPKSLQSWTLEIWIKKTENLIETAYPIFPR